MELTTTIEQTELTTTTTTPTRWYGCYDEGWQNLISEQAFSHPAKFSRSLIRRIYTYALERNWLKPGDTVLDPFGGVGLGALDALANGLSWIGCELEQRFTDLGQGCDCTGVSKADWIRFYGRWDKAAHTDGRHWCPRCLAEARQTSDASRGQLSFFEPAPTASYVRNSGIIPETQPHRYRGNLDLFKKYAQAGTWAVLLNGDSRNLRAVIGAAQVDGLLSSPPYANGEKGHPSLGSVNKDNWGRDGRDIAGRRGLNGNYGESSGQLANMPLGDALLSSPPYVNSVNQSAGANDTEARIERMRQAGIDVTNRANVGGANGVARQPQNYGSSDGQLGAMKEGDLDGLISSPPYVNIDPAKSGKGVDLKKNYETYRASGGGQSFEAYCRTQALHSQGYGSSNGQLSALPPGSFDAAVSSPPFAGNTGGRGEASRNGIDAALFDRHSGGMKRGTGDDPANLDHLPMRGFDAAVSSPPFGGSEIADNRKTINSTINGIGKGDGKPRGGTLANVIGSYVSEGNIAAEQGQTFWAAAKMIVTESYLVLKPGAYAFFVTKRFVRDGCIVDFTGQWRQLCEACGFEFVEHIQAMLIQSESEQGNLDGDVIKTKKKKSSFFRRIFEKRFPHLSIDNEDVLILRKPIK